MNTSSSRLTGIMRCTVTHNSAPAVASRGVRVTGGVNIVFTTIYWTDQARCAFLIHVATPRVLIWLEGLFNDDDGKCVS